MKTYRVFGLNESPFFIGKIGGFNSYNTSNFYYVNEIDNINIKNWFLEQGCKDDEVVLIINTYITDKGVINNECKYKVFMSHTTSLDKDIIPLNILQDIRDLSKEQTVVLTLTESLKESILSWFKNQDCCKEEKIIIHFVKELIT